jgi:hypothetical protein
MIREFKRQWRTWPSTDRVEFVIIGGIIGWAFAFLAFQIVRAAI